MTQWTQCDRIMITAYVQDQGLACFPSCPSRASGLFRVLLSVVLTTFESTCSLQFSGGTCDVQHLLICKVDELSSWLLKFLTVKHPRSPLQWTNDLTLVQGKHDNQNKQVIFNGELVLSQTMEFLSFHRCGQTWIVGRSSFPRIDVGV